MCDDFLCRHETSWQLLTSSQTHTAAFSAPVTVSQCMYDRETYVKATVEEVDRASDVRASSSLHVEAVCNWFSRFLERQWSSFMGLCVVTLPNSFFFDISISAGATNKDLSWICREHLSAHFKRYFSLHVDLCNYITRLPPRFATVFVSVRILLCPDFFFLMRSRLA